MTKTYFQVSFKEEERCSRRQKSGALAPVFPSILQDDKRHEEYIARMILRDKAANFG